MTLSTSKVVAVITARNEADNIGRLVKELVANPYLDVVYVMDDGSTDATCQLARKNGAVVFAHEASRGIRDSLLELWRNAVSAGATLIVQLDAGGSHQPEQVTRLITKAVQFDVDILVGSRFIPGGLYVSGHWWRKLGSRIFGALCRLCLPGTHVRDWTSGYRVFSRKALLTLKDRTYLTSGHTWQAEVLGHAFEAGLSVREAPITYVAGRSSMKPRALIDMLNVLSDLFFHRRVRHG